MRFFRRPPHIDVTDLPSFDEAYVRLAAASRQRAAVGAWRLALTALLLTIALGTLLTIGVALGLADPPRAARLIGVYDALDTLTPFTSSADVALTGDAIPRTDSLLPFTIRAAAINRAALDSAWGIWLQADGIEWLWLIDNQGYFSATSNSESPTWQEFIHLRGQEINSLTLHSEPDGSATLRINDEIAWQATIGAPQRWAIAQSNAPRLTIIDVEIYSG
ncbi:MAG: hypothetical protein GYB67_16190 [Chloroflexi bacterium]|nr:hypothetical protein [Chloroflexota bacterium]